MKKILNKKNIFVIITLSLMLLSGCNSNRYLSELVELNTVNIEEIKVYKKNHSVSIFNKEEDPFLKMIVITEKDKIDEFVIKLEEIKIVNDGHLSNRYNYDFDNNYIYVEIADKTLIFVENEVYYDMLYTIKNIDSINFIKELIDSN